MMLLSLIAVAPLLALVSAQRPPGLHGCKNFLAIGNDEVPLTGATTFSQYIQCTYTQNHPDGSVGTRYCWYDYMNYTLYHYPNTPLPVDSDNACPTDLPLASVYRVKTALNTNKCITASGTTNGSPVVIEDCQTGSGVWRPEQIWYFNNEHIQPLSTNLCLDVTNSNSPGGKLQVWTCGAGNPNQDFTHWVQNVVIVPEDHISWTGRGECLDVTDGILTNGNQLQMWSCGYQNPNQHWVIEPVF